MSESLTALVAAFLSSLRDREPEEYSSSCAYSQTDNAGCHKLKAKQFLPLALLAASDGEVRGKTRLQKLAFLTEQELIEHGIDPHEFVPYDYGPFSKDLMEDVETLESEGLVKINVRQTFGGDDRYDYRLTKHGREAYEENDPDYDWETVDDVTDGEDRFVCIDHFARDVVRDFGEMPLSNLIDHVYTEHPDYAQNSVFY